MLVDCAGHFEYCSCCLRDEINLVAAEVFERQLLACCPAMSVSRLEGQSRSGQLVKAFSSLWPIREGLHRTHEILTNSDSYFGSGSCHFAIEETSFSPRSRHRLEIEEPRALLWTIVLLSATQLDGVGPVTLFQWGLFQVFLGQDTNLVLRRCRVVSIT